MKTSRRRFLADVASGMGGWLVAPTVARLILTAAFDHGKILEVEVDRPKIVLYASFTLDYELSVGPPGPDIEWPTWREYLLFKNVNLSRPKDVSEWMIEYGGFDSENLMEYKPSILSELIDEGTYLRYLESEYVGPEERAHQYLKDLPLEADGQGGKSEIGGLEFQYRTVHTDSLAVLSGLQQRLLQLGEDTVVKMWLPEYPT